MDREIDAHLAMRTAELEEGGWEPASAREEARRLFGDRETSLVVSRTLAAFLCGVGPTDPVALVGALVLLGAAPLLASWIPARRGTRVDPTVAMRAE